MSMNNVHSFLRIIYFASRSNRSSFFGVVFLCLLFFLIAHDAVHIGLDGQKLLHLITGLPVAGIDCLFLRHQLRIFCFRINRITRLPEQNRAGAISLHGYYRLYSYIVRRNSSKRLRCFSDSALHRANSSRCSGVRPQSSFPSEKN